MFDINLRDYFAAHADVSWLYSITDAEIEAKTGVKAPDPGATLQEKINFTIRAEIAWRWIYADIMVEGFKPSIDRIDKLPKERKP